MAPAAPRWTRKRLEAMLGTCYGRTSTGHVDTAAVANAAGVSVRTVQRWMAGSNRQNAAIPHTRLLQLCRPPTHTQERSQQAADYASEAIMKISLPKGRGVLPAWREQGWLESHVVGILALRGLPLRQVVISNGTARSTADLRRRGELLDVTTVPTRFHATVLVHEVLSRVEPWCVLPSREILAVGRTQVWAEDGPVVDLSQLAVAAALR